jgi:ribose/xylose/arabinose/galactoside ABC-type transport system permease subunit
MTIQILTTNDEMKTANHGNRHSLVKFLQSYGLLVIFTLMFMILLIFSPNFRNPQNMLNLLQQNAVNGIIACGMTLMIISGGFDLSVGSTAALSGMVAAGLFLQAGIPLGIVGAIIAAIAVGICNGLLIAKVRINAFVATLASRLLLEVSCIYRRMLRLYTGCLLPT